jgi:uncharacterized membrane protein YczE
MTLTSHATQIWSIFLKRLSFLFFSNFLFSVGIVANLHSDLGMHPWEVLHVGIANITPLSIGQTSQVVGFAVIVLGLLVGVAPGFGTLANMYFVGFFTDLIIAWDIIPVQTEITRQFELLMLGIVIMGMASLFYLKAKLGAGPRDSLMIGLVRKLNSARAHVLTLTLLALCRQTQTMHIESLCLVLPARSWTIV